MSADDRDHAAAAAQFEALGDGGSLVTHNYVILEATALLQRRFGMSAVHRLLDLLAPVETVWVDERIHRAGLAALIAAPGRDVSLVDRVSFEVMRDRGIAQAFAFDPDFAREGFATLPG